MGGDNNTLISSDNRVFLFHSSPPTELHRSSLNRSDGTNGYGLYSSVRILLSKRFIGHGGAAVRSAQRAIQVYPLCTNIFQRCCEVRH